MRALLKSRGVPVNRFIRCSARFSSESGPSDKQLQLGYGIIPRVVSLESLLRQEGRKHFHNLWSQGVVKAGDFFQLFNGLVVYTDLHNPLLKKYNFDPVEFMTGAKYAFIEVFRAISSKDLSDYSNGFSTESVSAQLLSEVLPSRVYDACVDATKEIHSKGMKIELKDISIVSASIHRVRTEVYMDPYKDMRKHFVKDGPDIVEVRKMQEDLFPKKPYDNGSVIATVEVLFDSMETYHNQIHTAEIDDETTVTRKNRSRWTFEACISGQSEMNWLVTSLGPKLQVN